MDHDDDRPGDQVDHQGGDRVDHQGGDHVDHQGGHDGDLGDRQVDMDSVHSPLVEGIFYFGQKLP